MWGWSGNHWATISIERKPTNAGFKVFTLAAKLTSTGRSYLLDFVPDIAKRSLTPSEALSRWETVMKDLDLSELTCDAWFGSLSWMNCHLNIAATMSLSSNRLADYLSIFRSGMRPGDYRVFYRQPCLVSLWWDSELFIVGTTKWSLLEERVATPAQTHGMELSAAPTVELLAGLEPRLSQNALISLSTWNLADLQGLCVALGEAKSMAFTRALFVCSLLYNSGGTCRELAERICRRRSPEIQPSVAPLPSLQSPPAVGGTPIIFCKLVHLELRKPCWQCSSPTGCRRISLSSAPQWMDQCSTSERATRPGMLYLYVVTPIVQSDALQLETNKSL